MTNARTAHRSIRLAVAGLVGAAALLAPLATTASARVEPTGPGIVTPIAVQSGTVSSVNGVLTVNAATNSASNIVIYPGGVQNSFLVSDNGAPLKPGNGCFTFQEWGIFCTTASHVVVRLGNGNDQLKIDATYVSSDVEAGSGNDTITTGKGADWVWGGSGKDVVVGGASDDMLHGGEDADYDSLTGGAGTDDCIKGDYYAECDNVTNTKDIPR